MLYVFGGDGTNLVEKANTRNWEWGDAANSFSHLLRNDDVEKFAHS